MIMGIKTKHIILGIVICMILYLTVLSYKSKFITNLMHTKRTTFLILGVDFVNNSVHSDTVLLLSYSPKNKILDVISIPRDTYLDVPQLKYKKISEVYAYLYNHTRNKLAAGKQLAKLIETTLLFSDKIKKKIEIPYCVVIDYSGFKKILDALGKIKITIYEPMHYDDNAGNLHIHFDPGEYFLSSEDALKYIRYRGPTGDYGRIARQQQFIKNVIKTATHIKNIIKLPLIITNIRRGVHTNITLWELLNIITEFRNLTQTNLRFSVLQGFPQGRYVYHDSEKIASLILYLSEEIVINENKKVGIKVYNASKERKLARKVTEFLRDHGYDVLSWGNWYCELPESKIIDYSGNASIVNNISQLLKIDNISNFYFHQLKSLSISSNNVTETQEDNFIPADLIIILGKDFSLLK